MSQSRKFDIWEADDIQQEIYLLVNQACHQFDENRGDEFTFYFNYVDVRLKNFKRDNYGTNVFKMNIADARSLETDVVEGVDNFIQKYRAIINERIPASIRADYLRFCEGIKLPHKRKIIVLNHIKDIINRSIKNEEIVYGED